MESIKELKVMITTYTNPNGSYPGWLRCCFSDIYQKVHYIDDKVPVITGKDLNEKSEYPQAGCIRCQVINVNGKIMVIDISNPFSLEDENGETVFEVFSDQIQ